jgi:hypothetical protein
MEKQLPKGSHIIIRGQVQTMKTSFTGLGFGLLGAIGLAYFDRRKFPILAGSFHYHHRITRRAGRNLLDTVDHPYNAERAIVDRRDYVHGSSYRQQYFDGLVCA